jgi:tetratricopeptide (TPR) repeat protein
MRKPSIVVFAFLMLVLSVSAFAQDESRASKTWEVQKYNISATLPQSETDRYLSARAILNLKNVSSAAASRLTLRISPNADVSSVKVNDATADFTKGEEKIGGNRNLQRIQVRVPSTPTGGNFSVTVDYKLKVEENSGLSALSPVGAQFLPLSFWYPTPNSWYFARGGDFAPFNLTVNGSSGLTALTSGIIETGARNSESTKPFVQSLKSQPFFIVGNWDVTNANAISVYLPKGAGAEEQKRANELTNLVSEAKNFTANLLGTAPDEPIKIVAVKRGAGFSSGATIFVDQNVFRRQKIDSQTAMIVAESVVKLWIGNAVSVSGDGFGAIREGLPRYIATQFLEKQFGKDVADIERLRQRTSYASIAQRDAPLNIVSPIDDYYYTAVANKGAMIWRLLAKRIGQDEFFGSLRSQSKDGNLDLAELRSAFALQKDFLDYSFDKVTDVNLLVGLPQVNNTETKIALRNAGSIETTANIVAITANGEKLNSQTTIAAKSFGEASFKTVNKIVRVEVDTDKLYPQTDYSDDVAPRELDNNDPILFIKRAFDQQDFAKAEKNARLVLQNTAHFDDARVWLARALLSQRKTSEAEKEFRNVLDEKLPTARSLAWANAELGDIALSAGQNAQAAKFFEEAINSDAEYGATLLARQGRVKTNTAAAVDESIKTFFAQFDKAAVSARKSELDSLIMSGEIPKFSSGISGQAEQWQTKILATDKIDANTFWVEANLNIKLLNKSPENGLAIFRLTKIGNNWKLSNVDVFEVR